MKSKAVSTVYHGHGVGVSEALAALAGFGGGGEVSERDVLGALRARGHIIKPLLSRMLEELPSICESTVLPLMDATSRAMLARVSRAWRATVVSSGLPRAGTRARRLVPLKLRDFGGSLELLAWAMANGCPWVKKSVPMWMAALKKRDGMKEGELELLNVVGKGLYGEEEGTPLWFATRDYMVNDEPGGLELATNLALKGADVNAVETHTGGGEITPLWLAAQGVYTGKEGGLELATLLVQKGAYLDIVGEQLDIVGGPHGCGNACTPLWFAAQAVCDGNPDGLELALLLVHKGANVNTTVGKDRDSDNAGTPLWFAARAVSDGSADGLELATLLIEKGADLDAIGTDEYGEESTPLWWAAEAMREGNEDGQKLALLLIRKGANVMRSTVRVQSQ
jgi:hypothetical protein